MNLVKSKHRIINYIDYKGISKPLFFAQTGIKRGFLDSDKLNQNISEEHIAKIIATYDDINLLWLITGNGEMILKETTLVVDPSSSCSENDDRIMELKDTIAAQKDTIIAQKETIAVQRNRIDDLENRLNEALAQLGGGGLDAAGDAGCAAVG